MIPATLERNSVSRKLDALNVVHEAVIKKKLVNDVKGRTAFVCI